MSRSRSADPREGRWVSSLFLVAGAILVLQARPWLGPRGWSWSLLAVGLASLLFGLQAGVWRGLLALPGTVLAYLVGGGNPLARRYEARLTSEAVVYVVFMVVLLLGALIGHSNMLLLVFALLAGAFVLNGVTTLSVIRRTRARRSLPDLVFAGEPLAVRVELTNRKRWLSSWMVLVEDRLRLNGQTLLPGVLFEQVPPRESREASYQVTPGERGLLEFLPLRIASRFPLGLWERSFEIDVREQVLVYPRLGRLTPRFRQLSDARQRTQSDAPARTGVYDEQFHRLREFRVGDSRRSIHWRTSARRNELMVREYQEQHAPEIVLVLDLWQPERPGPESLARVEQAVSFAATLAASRAHETLDTGLHLVLCGLETQSFGARGQGAALRGVLDALALAQASPRPDLGPACECVLERQFDGCRLLWVSTRTPQAAELAQASWPQTAPESLEWIGGTGLPLEELFETTDRPGGRA